MEMGKTHGAIFDNRKAQLMRFTHKKHTNPLLTIGDHTIVATTELHWLGLWLDPKLTSLLHILKMQQHGKATIAQLHRISHCYWGLSSQETHKLITTFLKPRILFGSIAWLTSRNQSKVKKIFNLLQNAANRLILGAFWSSPTNILSHDTNMISFMDIAVRAHHHFVYQRLEAPSSHPTRKLIKLSLHNTSRTHRDPIQLLIGIETLLMTDGTHLETIEPYPNPPWNLPLGEIENW